MESEVKKIRADWHVVSSKIAEVDLGCPLPPQTREQKKRAVEGYRECLFKLRTIENGLRKINTRDAQAVLYLVEDDKNHCTERIQRILEFHGNQDLFGDNKNN